jgi:hypothetical protein
MGNLGVRAAPGASELTTNYKKTDLTLLQTFYAFLMPS